MYQTIWETAEGEALPCKSEGGNCSDRFAVAVVKDGIVVSHVPRLFSAACTVFLKRAGVILCRVIGSRTYTKDLPQGTLEIPCQYLFHGRPTEVAKVKKVLTLVLGNGSGVHSFGSCRPDFRNSVDNTDGDVNSLSQTLSCSIELVVKKRRV